MQERTGRGKGCAPHAPLGSELRTESYLVCRVVQAADWAELYECTVHTLRARHGHSAYSAHAKKTAGWKVRASSSPYVGYQYTCVNMP